MADVVLMINGVVVYKGAVTEGPLELRRAGWDWLFQSQTVVPPLDLSASTPAEPSQPPSPPSAPSIASGFETFVDGADFATKWQAYAAAGKLLCCLPNQTLKIDAPITISTTAVTTQVHGLQGNGLRLESQLTGGHNLITVEVPDSGGKNISDRGLNISGVYIAGSGQDGDGLTLACPTQTDGLYCAVLRDVMVEHFGGNGIVLTGDVFESQLFNCFGNSNAKNGIVISSTQGTNAIASAIHLFGCGARDNQGNGVQLQGGARDVRMIGCYLVDNGAAGVTCDNGINSISQCGFENNAIGVDFNNYCSLMNNTFASDGRQAIQIRGVVYGPVLMINNNYEYEGGQTSNPPKYAQLTSDGNPRVVTTLNSWQEPSTVDSHITLNKLA